MPSKLKIAVAAAFPFPTLQGSQVLVRQLCEILSQRGHQIHLVTYGYGQFPYKPTFEIHRIRDLTSYRKLSSGPSFMKLVFDLLLAFRLHKVCRAHGVHLISAHNYEAALVSAVVGRICGVPVVYHSHGLLSEELTTYYRSPITRRFAEWLGRLFDRCAPGWVSYSLVFSEQERAVLESGGVPPEKIGVVPPGIALQDFQACGVHRESTTLRVVYAGNLDSYQNLPLILEAFKKVLAQMPGVKLLVVSSADFVHLRRLAGQAATAGSLEFVKASSFGEILRAMSTADLALSARTIRGGFPLKILNYMAAGLPVVAFESGSKGIRHLHNGYIAPDRDVDAYAGGIVLLLREGRLREQMSKKALIEVQKYSWARIAAQVESIYREFC